MKPKGIRVFDGLRMTTEHVDHLQSAMQSAVGDLRQILGLGRAQSGLAVAPSGADSVIVQPGVAFDADGNRLVLGQAQTLRVTFEAGQVAAYVCLRYEQVEGGEVEGRATLVWDSATVVIVPQQPRPEDKLVPLARLRSRPGASPPFIIEEAYWPGAVRPEPGPPVAPAAGEQATAGAGARSNGGGATPGAPPGKVPESGAPSGNGGATMVAATVTTGAPPQLEAPAPNIEAAAPAAVRPVESFFAGATWHVRQGVAHLKPAEGKERVIGGSLLPVLRRRLERPGNDGVLLALGETDVPLDINPASLTCYILIEVTAGTRMTAVAQGEATFAPDAISQFGLTVVQGATALPELTEQGIAQAPVALNLARASTADQGQILVRVDRRAGKGFRITCHLVWKGGVNAEMIQELESIKNDFTWHVSLGWKALGAV